MPREGGASSTPRLLDSITDISGILDRPPSRAMTVEGEADREWSVIARSEATKQSILPFCGAMDCFASLAMTGIDMVSRSRGADSARVVLEFSAPTKSEGAGKAGCWLAPAVSCAISARKTHTSIQVSAGASGLPCAMVLRLMPCSPRRRIRLASVAGELAARIARLSFANLRRLDTSHGCQDHTSIFWYSVKHAETKKTL